MNFVFFSLGLNYYISKFRANASREFFPVSYERLKGTDLLRQCRNTIACQRVFIIFTKLANRCGHVRLPNFLLLRPTVAKHTVLLFRIRAPLIKHCHFSKQNDPNNPILRLSALSLAVYENWQETSYLFRRVPSNNTKRRIDCFVKSCNFSNRYNRKYFIPVGRYIHIIYCCFNKKNDLILLAYTLEPCLENVIFIYLSISNRLLQFCLSYLHNQNWLQFTQS